MSRDAELTEVPNPAPPQSELGRLGHYRVIATLGRGGMGRVYRAEDTRLKRQVALKVMNKRFSAMPDSRRRFIREARSMAAVHHDNVVTIFEVGETGGTPYLAMELLEGGTLPIPGAGDRPTDASTILQLTEQIAAGLAAAHRKGIVHRDIKPGNIWIEQPSGRIKILDFGLAIASEPADSLETQGAVHGTLGYLSPEQARGETLDDRSDLFSLGVVLYQLACGRLPAGGGAVTGQLVRLMTVVPAPPHEVRPDFPKPVSDLIMRLLAKEPRDRFRSAESLQREIGKVRRQLEEEATAATAIVVASSSPPVAGEDSRAASKTPVSWLKQNRPLAGALAAAAGLLLIALAVWAFREPPRAAAPAATAPAERPTQAAVMARELDVLRLSEVPAGTSSVLSGDMARYQVLLENRAGSAEDDPRVLHRDARVLAQIAIYLKPAEATGPTKRLSPGFPKKLGRTMIPPPGEERRIEVDFLTTSLPAGDYEVSFELQSPSGTPIANSGSRLSVQENFATIDLLGFDKIRTGAGRGADTFVEHGSDAEFGGRPYVEVDLRGGDKPSRKHAYLRFDLASWSPGLQQLDRAILLLTLDAESYRGKTTIEAYGVGGRMPDDWQEKGDGHLTWEASPSVGNLEEYPFLARIEFDNGRGQLEKQSDLLRLFGPGLDDYLKDLDSSSATILLVRTTRNDKSTRFVSREGNSEAAPALALRAVRSADNEQP